MSDPIAISKHLLDAALEAHLSKSSAKLLKEILRKEEEINKIDTSTNKSSTNDISIDLNESFDPDKYSDPSTPDLSFPDSFDDNYDNINTININSNYNDNQTQQDIYNLKLKNVSLLAEIDNIKSISTINDNNNKKEIEMLKERISDLMKLQDTERALNNDNTNKANNYNKISIELQKFKDENLYLRNTLEEQSKLLTLTITQEKHHKSKEAEYIQTIENLKEDKAFLTKSNGNYESRDKENTRIIESKDNDIIRLEQHVIQLTQKLSNANANNNTNVNTNTEKIALTNVGITGNLEMIEAELRMLRESKISLEFERMGLQQRNDVLNQETVRLMKEISTIQREKYENISEVQAQLREKCFELATLGTTLEKRENIIRQLTRDIDMTKEENTMYRQAMHKLETDFGAREKALTTALEETKSHLHTYEMAEEEIDRAVMKAGCEIIDGADEAQVEAHLRKTVDGIATSTERRIHQSLALATKVLNLEKERDDLINRLNEAQTQIKTLTDENDSHNKTIFYTGQPTSYLVAKLRDEEKEKKLLSVKNKALVTMVKRLENVRDGLVVDNETLREKMKIILSQRKEVQQLCYLLENLKDEEEEDEDDDVEGGDGDTDVDDDYDNNEEDIKNIVEENDENVNNSLSISIESLGLDEGLRERMTSPKSDTSDKQRWYKTEAI